MLVLFGAGDGAGIVIDTRGRVRRVGPFAPDAVAVLKAAVAVLHARERVVERRDRARDLEAVAERLTASIVPRLSAGAGLDDDGHAVMFLDRDGGFVCGTSGRHPLPMPAPAMLPNAAVLAAHAGLATAGR